VTATRLVPRFGQNANHAKKEGDWGFPSRIWRISRLNLFAAVRTNPIWQGQMCRTNPIRRGPEDAPLRHRDHRDGPKPVPKAALTLCTLCLCGEHSCKTKPNRGDLGYLGDRTAAGRAQGKCAKQTQCARRGRGAGRGMLYKQSQFPAGQKEGQVLGGKGVMVNRTSDRPRQNKANSHCDADREIGVPGQPNLRNKANCPKRGTAAVSGSRPDGPEDPWHKQSQFAADGPHRAKQSQFPPGRCRARTPNPRRARGYRAKQSQFR
jgi:hypothetical protein